MRGITDLEMLWRHIIFVWRWKFFFHSAYNLYKALETPFKNKLKLNFE